MSEPDGRNKQPAEAARPELIPVDFAEPGDDWLPVQGRGTAAPAATAPPISDKTAATGQSASKVQDQAETGPLDDDAVLMVEDRLTAARQRGPRTSGQARGAAGSLLREALIQFSTAVERLAPAGYRPPAFSPEEVLAFLQRLLGSWYPLLEPALRRQVERGYLNPDVWRGLWAVLAYLARTPTQALRQRWLGEYELDEFGLDQEFVDALRPLLAVLYHYYWRVEVSGSEHIPAEGRGLLVSNHSGALPFDGMMIATAVYQETGKQRWPRVLAGPLVPTLPFISIVLQRMGQVLATPENALRLLERDELAVVFPEGYQGVSKLYRDRYRLTHFGQGSFCRVAIQAAAPIVPVAVVGAEETYPMLGRSQVLAHLLGLPYFPLTPFFPWLGLLGLVPLPTKWFIDFGKPLYPEVGGAEAAANPALAQRLSRQVQSHIQEMLLRRLARRRSLFVG